MRVSRIKKWKHRCNRGAWLPIFSKLPNSKSSFQLQMVWIHFSQRLLGSLWALTDKPAIFTLGIACGWCVPSYHFNKPLLTKATTSNWKKLEMAGLVYADSTRLYTRLWALVQSRKPDVSGCVRVWVFVHHKDWSLHTPDSPLPWQLWAKNSVVFLQSFY